MITWMLLSVFMLPFVVKSVHACHLDTVVLEEDHRSHDCTDCPVCHFVFSYFIETDPLAETILMVSGTMDPVVYRGKSLDRVSLASPSRAPPAI
ncbi:MAG: hypothetical protein LBP56_07200 [Odoribacteraceae bacterium]|nr:hypothetical protein [Odoribacteraceae bacterium]